MNASVDVAVADAYVTPEVDGAIGGGVRVCRRSLARLLTLQSFRVAIPLGFHAVVWVCYWTPC